MSTGFIFGWAKPVPINFNALRSPKSGMIWVALAGPGANLIMAIGWIFIAIHSINIPVMLKMAGAGIFINILLAVFNLLPIPPLDGSRVISALLPNPLAYKYNQLERYGFLILIGLMFIGGFSYIVWPIVGLALSSLSVISGLNLINLMSYVFS
jgi:Zn-dependent protease